MPSQPMPMITVVVPAKNEAANLPHLFDEVEAALAGMEFEIILVDDGSTDETGAVMQAEMKKRSFPLRHVRHSESAGKSLALRSGAFAARGELVATIDGDGQNDPAYIVPLVEALLAGGPNTGIAAGQRLKRKHSALKNAASRFANALRRAILDDDTRDTACGLKVVRADVFRKLPFFEGSHRFLPALVLQERYGVVHIDVIDRPRVHGASHYGILDRGLHGALDLIGVWWLRRRRKRMPRPEEL